MPLLRAKAQPRTKKPMSPRGRVGGGFVDESDKVVGASHVVFNVV